MRKLAIVILIMLLTVTCFAVTAPVYAQNTNNADIHLINPVSVVANGDQLYVADNVTEDISVIHIFDISTDNATLVATRQYQGKISRLRCYDNNTYAIFADRYIVIDSQSTTTVNTAISDIAIYINANANIPFTIRNDLIYRRESNQGWNGSNMAFNGNQLSAIYQGELTQYQLVQDQDGITVSVGQKQATAYTHITVIGNDTAYYNGSELQFGNYTIPHETDTTIISVAGHNSDVYMLSTSNKITKYTLVDTNYTKVDGYEIGSDTVSQEVPTFDSINSYTLVSAQSYPANIIYKTTADNSIASLQEVANNTSYIILGYSGSANVGYYYVMYNNAFGWVKKSDGATDVASDNAVAIINTTLDSVASYHAKLMSPNKVDIYYLPLSGNSMSQSMVKNVIVQSATNYTEVELLQLITAPDNTAWYYISYVDSNDTTQYGWVLTGQVGQIYSSRSNHNNILLDSTHPRMKINASLSQDVSIYLTEQMLDDQQLVDSNNNAIMLTSNTRVNVITYTTTSSYIQVQTNGDTYYGWIDSNYLIDNNDLTTGTIVGLSLLGGAMVIAILVVLIVKARKKNIQQDNTITLD